jgi:hypothetical protein
LIPMKTTFFINLCRAPLQVTRRRPYVQRCLFQAPVLRFGQRPAGSGNAPSSDPQNRPNTRYSIIRLHPGLCKEPPARVVRR